MRKWKPYSNLNEKRNIFLVQLLGSKKGRVTSTAQGAFGENKEVLLKSKGPKFPWSVVRGFPRPGSPLGLGVPRPGFSRFPRLGPLHTG